MLAFPYEQRVAEANEVEGTIVQGNANLCSGALDTQFQRQAAVARWASGRSGFYTKG